MKHLRTRRSIRKQWAKSKRFVLTHTATFILLSMILIGVFFGVRIYRLLDADYRAFVQNYIYTPSTPDGWIASANAVAGLCIKHMLIPVSLFFLGMTAFGCPLILCMIVLFGFRVGLILSVSYTAFGVLHTACIVYIPLLLVGIATLLAVRRSLHMSYTFSCQLLPSCAHCGGMWSEFKRYLLSYSVTFGLIVTASVAEVILQMVKTMV